MDLEVMCYVASSKNSAIPKICPCTLFNAQTLTPVANVFSGTLCCVYIDWCMLWSVRPSW